MKKTHTAKFRKKTPSDVNAEVIARLKKARLAAHVTLQQAGTHLRISMSALWWMEKGVCPVTQEQAEALFAFYAASACAIAEDVAAAMGA